MKRLLLLVPACFALSLSAKNSKPINPIIGDQSYIMKYGVAPNDQTNDHDRILTHVSYAEFLLRTADVSGMTEEQKQKRAHTLDLLHEYWVRGVFPRNDDYRTERQPCFIDANGTICAVGYLVEQTAGRETAELISQRHLYQTILEMKDPVLEEWVKTTGLTLEECAIIQPSYEWSDPDPEGFLSYGVSYRMGDNLYHSIQIYSKKEVRSHSRIYRRSGVRFDWLRAGDFSAGIHYSRTMGYRYWKSGGPNAGITAETFCYNSTWGMNLRPELEFVKSWEHFEMGLGYSYAIPIIAEEKYGAGRHDLSLRLAWNLSNIEINIPKRQKNQDAQQGSGA